MQLFYALYTNLQKESYTTFTDNSLRILTFEFNALRQQHVSV